MRFDISDSNANGRLLTNLGSILEAIAPLGMISLKMMKIKFSRIVNIGLNVK
jgi:hypothetical protein